MSTRLKKTVVFALTVIIAALTAVLLSTTASAESYSGICGKDLRWKLDTATGVLEINGTGAMTDWLSSSGAPWSDYRNTIVTINMASGATDIGNYAFCYCNSLKQITIPSSVTEIGSNAFQGCTLLESISVPSNVISIDSYAFNGCTLLKNISLPDSVTYIAQKAFKATAYYDDYSNWDDGVLYIGKCLISADKDWLPRTYSVLDGTVLIAERAFSNCQNVNSISIPNSVINIGSYAFYFCINLQNINIPKGVKEIKESTFSECRIRSITIPSGVTAIGDYAFSSCSDLTSIVIPSGVESIGKGSFRSCTNLSSITLPSSVISVGENAFESTAYYNTTGNWIKNALYIGKCLINYNSVSSGAYSIVDGTVTIADDAFKSRAYSYYNVIIPSSVIHIGKKAFANSNIKGVVIPSSVKSIGDYAFDTCKYLTSITIPYGIKNIGDCMFKGCTALETVSLPASVEAIGDHAFEGCDSLTNITLPTGLTSIGIYAFYDCAKLKTITAFPSISFIGYDVFTRSKELTVNCYEGSYIHTYCAVLKVPFALLEKVSVKGVSLDLPSKTIDVGSSLQLKATVTPGDATFTAVTWKSSNASVAEVDANGLVRAKTAGTATITVTNTDSGLCATCNLTVVIPVSSVSLSAVSKTVAVGNTAQLTANVLPANASNKAVIWVSSNEAVASVSATGLVTAKVPGTAVVSATTVDGGCKATCEIIVVIPVTGIVLDDTQKELVTGAAYRLTATVAPADATNKTVTWQSSNADIVSVSAAGIISAKAPGTATVTATAVDGGFKATCRISVTMRVSGVTLNASQKVLTVGGKYQLNAAVLPENATDKTVTWQSDNTAAADVSSNGLVTAKAAGKAKITVTTADGGYKSTCDITVKPKTVTGLKATSASSTSVRLTWNKLSGVDGYIVYLYNTSTKSYSVKMTVARNENYCTLTGLKSNSKLYIKVCSYKNIDSAAYYGSRSSTLIVYTAPAKVSGLKQTGATSSSIKLTWSKTSGAQGYTVYKYDTAKKQYVKYKTVKTNSCTVSKLNGGTKYTFRVTAYRKAGGLTCTGSNSSSYKACTAPAKVTGLKQNTAKKGIEFTWKKTTGATGYEVQYYNASTKKYVTISKPTSNKLGSSAAKGTMKFRVRAFKTLNGRTYYGSYSTAKSFKAR